MSWPAMVSFMSSITLFCNLHYLYLPMNRNCHMLVFSSGEDKKNQDRMTDLASKLQSKIKTYKQQIEEAEEIAALNLAKFRKAQQELEEVEERAKLAALL